MKRYATLLILVACLLGCSKPVDIATPTQLQSNNPSDPMTKEALDQFILGKVEESGVFNWETVDTYTLWSALSHNEWVVTIGYQPAGEKDINSRIHTLDMADEQWVNARKQIVNRVGEIVEAEQNEPLGANTLRNYADPTLPYLVMQVKSFNALEALREMPEVRYLEVADYVIDDPGADNQRSSKGCGDNPVNLNSITQDFTAIGNAIVPWNFYNMGIPQAWGQSNGDNITVGLIDTGISPGQINLTTNFTGGLVPYRYVERYGTFDPSFWWWWDYEPDGPNDDCSHGTSMAGFIAAPRNTSLRSTTGVAYGANLISVRGTNDVVINEGNEKKGVSDALVLLGNRSDVRIISMSLGDVISSGQVSDAIRYAYGRGKLIFTAAGTSLSFTNWYGVIFPANMSETVAVTGITDNPSRLEECEVCHYGSKVDFSLPMQRAGDGDRTSLTLSRQTDYPDNKIEYVGGSSCATATLAGIAAEVWSKDPYQSRSQVLDKLIRASQLYPYRNSRFGWGSVNVAEALQ